MCKKYIQTCFYINRSTQHKNEVKKSDFYFNQVYGRFLEASKVKTYNPRVVAKLERIGEVGKGWMRRGEVKHQGKGWRKGEEMVENEEEKGFL